ncbi:hypothetical protein BD779DRAFT_1670797 [Infundibulicybe gibba]|nr:hypothetical protein BD779DRAFT_1670797 [Infundibulicybe gibba]
MKPHHHPLAGHRVVSGISFVLLLTAFILLLLVSISLPILKPVYILAFKSTATGQPATSIATELRFGVWGVCASSTLNQPTFFTNNGLCFGPKLGYDVPDYISSLVGISPTLITAIQKGLLAILVLHPIAAGLSFLAMISSLFLASHTLAINTLIMSILTGIISSIVFAIDLALVIIARNKLKDLANFRFTVEWGNAVWMILAAVALTWLAIIFISARVCYCCGVRKWEKC